jgi:hypothetical protein
VPHALDLAVELKRAADVIRSGRVDRLEAGERERLATAVQTAADAIVSQIEATPDARRRAG